MDNYGRLDTMFPSGASGAAPGNKFPDLGFDDTAMFNRQNRMALDEFERQKQLMRLAATLRGGGGNANGPKNTYYDHGMDVVFKDSPNPNILSRQDQEELKLRNRALDNQLNIAGSRNDYNERKLAGELAIKQQRADTYEDRTNRPNLKTFRGADGKEYTWDTSTGQIVSELGPSARMTDDEIARRRQSDMLERIAKQLEGNIQRDDNRAQNESNLIGERTRGQIDINNNRANQPPDPREQMQDLDLRFRTAINNPEFSPFIEMSPDGRTPRLVDASKLNPQQLATYQKVRSYLFPSSGNRPTANNSTPASSPTPTVTVPPGQVVMIGPNGKRGYVPADRVNAYLQSGKGYKLAEGGK